MREKIRQAIVKGELTGKLPGERALATHFGANAKTLSKALTDLAAEGLLDRSIGRGTYVKGSRPQLAGEDCWLLLSSVEHAQSELVKRLLSANSGSHVISTDVSTLRPSFISQFGAVIDLTDATPDAFVRDLMVRGIPVVTVGREPRGYSTHVVAMDRVAGLSHLARDLTLRGHRHFAAVEAQGSSDLSSTLRTVARRYARDVEVDSCYVEDVMTMINHGVSAIVCDAPDSAHRVAAVLQREGIDVPGQVSLAAIGCDGESARRFSGYYVTVEQKAQAIISLLRDRPSRPAILWLAPRSFDAGTTGDFQMRSLEQFTLPMLASA
ncbi:MAG: GntR family transcriptional regulator [Chthoniobacterales bacterium]|nr:GntR family transcriptional regulator [Chthoniobacterales bacterium]